MEYLADSATTGENHRLALEFECSGAVPNAPVARDSGAGSRNHRSHLGIIGTPGGLERDLQRALRSNIEQLEPGLKITDGGNEKSVPSGRIDIAAQDRNGANVVIELKAGEADRDAIGQVLSYMGDSAGDGNPVRGILVAGDFSARAISAARAVPNLDDSAKGPAIQFTAAKRLDPVCQRFHT